MCGIAGFCNWKRDWEKNIRKMNERMRHRGPDASGIWASEDGDVVLGHQRLSIVDLSENGAHRWKWSLMVKSIITGRSQRG